jgi:hypothetical protein
MKNFVLKPVYFIILGVVLGLGGFFLVLANPLNFKLPRPFFIKQSSNNSFPVPGSMAAPTPHLILPSGKQIFYVRGGETDYSKISQVTINPLDATKGTNQSIDIAISSIEPISSFKINLTTDTQTTSYTPTVTSGNATKGIWTASYTFPDSSTKIYKYVFEIITNTNKKTTIPFLVR